MGKDDTTSPTALNEAIQLTAVVDAEERRDVAIVDIPHAFVQTDLPESEDGVRITMKISGPLVDMLVEIAPEAYKGQVIYEGKTKVLYVQVLKAIYGMLQSAMLFYKKLRKDLEEYGFVINLYDPYVANKMVNSSQHTITWHVNDLKSSHKDPKVNDEFIK